MHCRHATSARDPLRPLARGAKSHPNAPNFIDLYMDGKINDAVDLIDAGTSIRAAVLGECIVPRSAARRSADRGPAHEGGCTGSRDGDAERGARSLRKKRAGSGRCGRGPAHGRGEEKADAGQ